MSRADRRAQWRARNREHDAATMTPSGQEGHDGWRPGPVNVSIGTLVLEGYHRSDRYAIAESMQAELRALIAADGVPEAFRAPAAIARYPAPTITTGPASKPAAIGAAVAGAIYRGGRS